MTEQTISSARATSAPIRRDHPGVVVIEHEPGCPLDRFAGWLDDLTVEVVRPYAGDPVPGSVNGGLIVLGGQMSAYDDGVAPWLPAVRDLLAVSVSERVPTLAICLGAQLLAVACGGTVEVGAAPGRESGVVDVSWLPAAMTDPLVAGLPDPAAGPSMHADAVAELPAGAVRLGSSTMYPHQVFRVGELAWGVQFHPEVSAATFRSWAELHPEVDTDPVVAEMVVRQDDVTATGRRLARRFSSLVAQAVGPGDQSLAAGT
jgi:GMP synthase (glutamine-hydrolysing)